MQIKNKAKDNAIGILFQTDMVQAITSSNKTETRRPQGLENLTNHKLWKKEFIDGRLCVSFQHPETKKITVVKSRWSLDQLLYIKETYDKTTGCMGSILYKAKYDPETLKQKNLFKWSSSQYMPKAYARVWLRVVDIDCQRLHCMKFEDFTAEGFGPTMEAAVHFEDKWRSIYGNIDNVWLWVLRFKVEYKNGYNDLPAHKNDYVRKEK